MGILKMLGFRKRRRKLPLLLRVLGYKRIRRRKVYERDFLKQRDSYFKD